MRKISTCPEVARKSQFPVEKFLAMHLGVWSLWSWGAGYMTYEVNT